MADTRKDKRAPVSLKVRFKSATVDEFIEHYSKDVSRGGLYIKSSQPMPIGTLLKFQFQLKDESALIRGVGRVVWTRAEEDAGEDQPAGMGIKFIKMDNESRAMVERIVDSHAPGEGMFERGREGATEIAESSVPPPPESGSFFPDLGPAEQPAPEDRTAVRQVTELLAAALAEAGTDEDATREAQERAEEARRRTEEIERERRQEAERRRKDAERQGGLPSMIIDPTLAPRGARNSPDEQPSKLTPLPRPVAAPPPPMSEEDEREPDTEPPMLAVAPAEPATTSIPQAAPPVQRSYLPYAVIVLLLIVAAVVALRGGPREIPIAASEEVVEPAPTPPQIAPAPAPAAAPSEPAAAEPQAVQPVAPTPPAPVALVKVDVATTPKGAEVLVDDVPRGAAPLSLELPENVPVVLRARLRGHTEVSETVTPRTPELRKLTLPALPYVVHLESTPAGALVTVGGKRGTAPVDLTLPAPPQADLPVTAKLSGYDTVRTRLSPAAFAEADGMMRAMLSLTLRASAAPKPAPEKQPKPQGEAEAPAAPEAPKAAPPEPKPEQPKPVEAPAPREELPDNPFGD